MTAGTFSTLERLLSNMTMLILIFCDTPKVLRVLPGSYHMCEPAQRAYVLPPELQELYYPEDPSTVFNMAGCNWQA